MRYLSYTLMGISILILYFYIISVKANLNYLTKRVEELESRALVLEADLCVHLGNCNKYFDLEPRK